MDKRNILDNRPQTTDHRRRIAFVLFVILAAAAAAEARVYLRWGAAANVARMIADAGGRLAYRTELTVNGRRARISVFGLPESKISWLNSVKSISFTIGDTVSALTGINIAGKPLIFDYQRQASGTPDESIRSSIPRFPQSSQTFFAHDENADMSVSVSASSSSPEQVRSYYRQVMKAEGWHIPSASSEGRSEGMSTFIRKQEVACVAVERTKNSNETRITLLHKKLRIK